VHVETSEKAGHYVVTVSGEVDVHTAPDLRAELNRLSSEGAERVTVDLDQVEFIDSTGLSVLLGGHRKAEEEKRQFVVRTTSERTLKLLRISGLLEKLTVEPSPNEAG